MTGGNRSRRATAVEIAKTVKRHKDNRDQGDRDDGAEDNRGY